MTATGIPAVDHERCTGCGICVTVCPKDLWSFVPRVHRVELSCMAYDKRSVVRAACAVGCILCRRCVAKCPAGAITWDGQTIVVEPRAVRGLRPILQRSVRGRLPQRDTPSGGAASGSRTGAPAAVEV